MTVTVARVFLVDGVEVQVQCEGGSAKEAYVYVQQAAEELGAAPNGPSEAAADKAKRKRRTKAEIAADEATAAGKPEVQVPAALPAGVVHAFPTPTPYPGQPGVAFTDDPPVPLGHSEVALAPGGPPPFSGPPPAPYAAPPPPVLTPEQQKRLDVQAAIDHLLESVPDTWRASVGQTVGSLITQQGGAIDKMSMGKLDALLGGVKQYQEACDRAPK